MLLHQSAFTPILRINVIDEYLPIRGGHKQTWKLLDSDWSGETLESVFFSVNTRLNFVDCCVMSAGLTLPGHRHSSDPPSGAGRWQRLGLDSSCLTPVLGGSYWLLWTSYLHMLTKRELPPPHCERDTNTNTDKVKTCQWKQTIWLIRSVVN